MSTAALPGRLAAHRLEEWYEFCARCFKDKPSPPAAAYFRAHFELDPWRDARLIFLTREGGAEGAIQSTVRVYRRKLSGLGCSLSVGGIAEVCTAQESRGRGLSRGLLGAALEDMSARQTDVALLHAGEWIRGFYESEMFRAVSVKYVPWKPPDAASARWHAVEPDWDDAGDLAALDAMYSDLVSLIAICIERSAVYWAQWVPWTLRRRGWRCVMLRREEGSPAAAYAILGSEESKTWVFEFGANKHASQEDCLNALVAAVGPLRAEQVVVPRWLAERLGLDCPAQDEREDSSVDDGGWMVR